MGSISVDKILVTPLNRLSFEGADVMHMKQSDTGYTGFGEDYFSWVSAAAVKAWKRHAQITMNVVVPVWQEKFVFRCVTGDGDEEFRLEENGDNRNARLTVTPGIWDGFQRLSKSPSLVLNIANIQHDPNEVERLSLSDINYVWN